MKNFTLCFLLYLASTTTNLTAQICDTVPPFLFGEPQENPFGLFNPVDDPQLTLVFPLDVDGDCKVDIFVTDIICLGPGCEGGVQSKTNYFHNIGEEQPGFELAGVFENTQAPFGWPDIPNVDIDGDCDLDIVRGFAFAVEQDTSNIINLIYYENKAADNDNPGGYDFSNSTRQVNPWGIELPGSPFPGSDSPLALIWPTFGDMDGDGDQDMFTGGFWLGNPDEQYVYFENNTNENGGDISFGPAQFDPFGLELPLHFNHYSKLVDIDCDGDLDIFTKFANAAGSLYFYENTGDPMNPVFNCDPILIPNYDFNPAYGAFIDLNGDGLLDVLSGGNGVFYSENITEGQDCSLFSLTPYFNVMKDGYSVNLTDQSSGNPDCYYWDFGDGNTSNEQNPVHTYAEGGDYLICLTITKGVECEMTCETITKATDLDQPLTLDITPNPFSDLFTLQLQSNKYLEKVNLDIFAPNGELINSQILQINEYSAEKRIDLRNHPSGFYMLRVYSDNYTKTFKCLKIN